jgi:hypothetical protein
MPPEIVRGRVEKGQSFAAVVEKILAAGAGYAEVRVGDNFTIAKADGPVRSCGDCYACCVMPGIDVLKKHPMQACRNLEQHRCRIYASRPDACSRFYCSWTLGNFAEEDQPQKIGAVVGIYEFDGDVLASILVDSKKADTKRIWAIFCELAALFPQVQVIVDDRRILVLRDGQLRRGGIIKPRPRGDYESTTYRLEGEPIEVSDAVLQRSLAVW